MNLSANNLNFGAKYNVWGKQTCAQTAQVYKNAASKHSQKGLIAVQAQEYMQTPVIQKTVEQQLPKDAFVRLHTGVLDGEKKKEDMVLGFVPYIAFEAKTINEQIAISKALGGQDTLKLSLDETGNLNKNEINNWLDLIQKYYQL